MMLSTAAHPSPFDPLADMPLDEPRFVLRGRDPVGPGAITEWARLRRNWAIKQWADSSSEEAQRRLQAELRQCAAAEEQAMEWAERLAGGEAVEAVNATYQDVHRTEEQLAALGREKRIAALQRHLREAAYHTCEARDGYAAIDELGAEDAHALEQALATINRIADAHDRRKEAA